MFESPKPRTPKKMADPSSLRQAFLRLPPFSTWSAGTRFLTLYHAQRAQYATATTNDSGIDCDDVIKKKKGEWFKLPPFTSGVDGSALGKEIAGRSSETDKTSITALKWVLRCCPQLPRSLVQKLFRLRQVRRESSDIASTNLDAQAQEHRLKRVRRESSDIASSNLDAQAQEHRLKRVTAKDSMNYGDQIFLPITVQKQPFEKPDELGKEEEEGSFLHKLELYKDEAIIAINKPPGMPVQGGIGIKRSLDKLAAAYMRYGYSEPPRLVHRLDRDSSGILLLGRTQLSATVLHSIFREKTFGASNNDMDEEKRILRRTYLALVIGCPRRREGLISMPLGKVVLDNGKAERITVIENAQTQAAQHAITEYRVIESSAHGYTWLELSPLTGRKHQLRVHCAEVLGTPIVGDYKYGWQAHRKWSHFACPVPEISQNNKLQKEETFSFGLNLDTGSILEKQPGLHLHCKEMILPNVSLALQRARLSSDCDFEELESLKLVAPLPKHMQKSWEALKS